MISKLLRKNTPLLSILLYALANIIELIKTNPMKFPNPFRFLPSTFCVKAFLFLNLKINLMKNLKSFLLFIFIGIAQQAYTQNSSFWISFQKEPMGYARTCYNNCLYEVEDISKFKVSEEIPNFVIGYLNLSEFHDWYHARHSLLKYQSIVEKYQIDTLQFTYNNLKQTKLYVLVYLKNGYKHVVIDSDFDSSFLGEEVYKCKFKAMRNWENDENENEDDDDDDNDNEYIFTELKIPVDSFQYTTIKTVPVTILMNETRRPEEKLGNNDSLQIYITEHFIYKSYFMDNTDTVYLTMYPQYFDLLYSNYWLSLGCYCPSCYYSRSSHFGFGKQFKVKNHNYLLEDFDPFNKKAKFTRLADDTIETKPGEFLIPLPGLDSINRYTLVYFTGSWCGNPCKLATSSLLDFHQQYPNIDIISVNQESDTLKYLKHIEKLKIPWKLIYDNMSRNEGIGGSKYFTTYNIQGVPWLFLISPKQRILRIEGSGTGCRDLINEIKEKGCEAFDIYD